MTAAIYNKLGAGRPPEAPPLLYRDAVGAGPPNAVAVAGALSSPSRGLEAAVARCRQAVLDRMYRLRDGAARRQAIRELRRMGRSRLADIGISEDAIEDAVDAMLAARRSRTGGADGHCKPGD